MFSYYGGKGRIGKRYDAPRYPLVIEPFCGAAWYSVLHEAPKALLFDVDDNIALAWDWLLNRATAEAIEGWEPYMPQWRMQRHADPGEDVVYRFNGNQGTEKPRNVAGSFCTSRIKYSRVEHARAGGWEFRKASYEQAPDIEATWFIDPPYQKQSRYQHNNVDYGFLAKWVRSRRGQVIVCESEGADWLPFRPHLTRDRAPTGRPTSKLRNEVIWTNEESWLE